MIRLVSILVVGVATCCFANGPQSRPVGSEVEIVWTAPSNQWPAKVWVYDVTPQNFAPHTLSNLTALGSFTAADRTNVSGSRRPNDRAIFFRNASATKHLGIFSSLGWIDYEDLDAIVSMEDSSPARVPSEEACFQLALSWLPKLGIDRSELATMGDSQELRVYRVVRRRGWLDKTTGANTNEVILRGVSFIRRVDGIDFDGIGYRGGLAMNFGNDGKIAKLEMVWRNLERSRSHATLTASEMTDAIRAGKAKWQPPVPDQDGIKKVTVTGVMPLYRGKNGNEEQKVVEPYARLATLVDYGFTNVVANLECPILGAPKSDLKGHDTQQDFATYFVENQLTLRCPPKRGIFS